MKKTLLISMIILTSSPIIIGQEIIEKKYYKTEFDSKPIDEKRAKVVELTIKESNGTLRYEIRELKSDKLLKLTKYKDGIPVGKWLYLSDNSDDYFELEYNNKEYESVLHFDIEENNLLGEYISKFDAPIFPRYNNNFFLFIVNNLKYPEIAADNGIQGQVVSQFILDESGKIIDFSILKSVNPELDREAARVILLSPDWIPAKLNGQPIRVHTVVTINFILK